LEYSAARDSHWDIQQHQMAVGIFSSTRWLLGYSAGDGRLGVQQEMAIGIFSRRWPLGYSAADWHWDIQQHEIMIRPNTKLCARNLSFGRRRDETHGDQT